MLLIPLNIAKKKAGETMAISDWSFRNNGDL